MIGRRLWGVAAICLGVLVSPTPAQAHPLDVVRFDDPVYRDLYRVAADGLAPLWAVPLRPLTRLELARIVARSLDRLTADRTAYNLSNLTTLEQLVLQFSDELALLGYRVVEPPQGPSAAAITGWGVRVQRTFVWRATGGTPPWFATNTASTVRVDIAASEGLGPNLAVGTRFQHILVPSPATIALDGGYLSIGEAGVTQVEYERLWWGPATRGALVLSDNAGALQTVRVSSEQDRLRLVKLLAVINDPTERYLYGLRMDWLATDALRIGVGETLMTSGGMYMPYALNPLPFLNYGLDLWIRQRQMGISDPYNIGVDFDWRIGRGTVFYGEVFADDLFTRVAPFPTTGGATAGLFFGNVFGNSGADLRLEHSRITNWTYAPATVGSTNNYTLGGKALGHWCAPDCELYAVELSRGIGTESRLLLGYDLVRKGQGRLGTIWGTTNLSAQCSASATPAVCDAWEKLYLSGVVETTQSWRLSYSWMWNPSSQHEVGVSWSSVTNAGNASGQTSQNWFVWWEAHVGF